MKLHKPEQAPPIMRVNIKKQGYKNEHVAIEGATQEVVSEWLKDLIRKQNLDVLATGRITNVQVRETIEGENGKSMSFAFKGLDPLEVKELILENLKQ